MRRATRNNPPHMTVTGNHRQSLFESDSVRIGIASPLSELREGECAQNGKRREACPK